MQKKQTDNQLVWTRRFIAAAIIQGAIIVGLTIYLILGQISLKPEVSRVIAAGNAGTWFTFGYILYIVVGVLGIAVSALFYLYLEKVLGKQYKDSTVAKIAAWIHLLFLNVGTVAAMGMLMFVGYIGGAAMLPISIGGRGFNALQAHEILAPFVEPIAASIFIILIGVISGGIGFLIIHRKKMI
jgi:putative flippase GtrA